MRRHWMPMLLGLLASILLPGCASVIKVPCNEPEISNWSAPSVYVVKLPFVIDASLAELTEAERVDPLLQLQAVSIASNLGQSHLTLLDAPPDGSCDITSVYDKVTASKSGAFGRRLFRSAIFVWGDIYETDGSLYIQTYMRVFWNGQEGTARITYQLSDWEAPLQFAGRFPSSTIIFPPRLLTRDALKKLADGAAELKPRAIPDRDGPEVAMPKSFVVAGSNRGWIFLLSRSGQDAWLSKDVIAEQSIGLVPEFEFVRAVAAYLQYAVDGSERSARISEESLERFERQYPDARQPALKLPLAVGDVIRGTFKQGRRKAAKAQNAGGALTLASACPSVQRVAAAVALENFEAKDADAAPVDFEQAIERTADDSDVLTLSALGKIPSLCTGPDPRRDVDTITRAFEDARLIDAANPTAATNLLNWYRLLARLDAAWLPSATSSRQFTDKANALERALSFP